MRTPIDQIKGNASEEHKTRLNDAMNWINKKGIFGYAIMDRIVIVEAGVVDANDEAVGGERRKMIRAVYEMEVKADMCNGGNSIHGGCGAYLADVCTSSTYSLHDDWNFGHVSAALDCIYHAPALEGTNLRIICTLVALGGRIGTSRCEILDKDNGRLVCSASHLKMKASSSKAKL
ncbi:hypothetical protein FRB95_006548 [Tulasnella sp. JGI-2019a]|nr:hypothetical protein FRB95_006548 [Tulasnella sp. JGI-2019a]